jgi:hypothetical protein
VHDASLSNGGGFIRPVGDKSDEATHESEMKRPVAVREGLCETLMVISHVARIYLFIPAH